jgi:murein DD-endopeptidase MepM/ murein hydrolase activator NlpD
VPAEAKTTAKALKTDKADLKSARAERLAAEKADRKADMDSQKTAVKTSTKTAASPAQSQTDKGPKKDEVKSPSSLTASTNKAVAKTTASPAEAARKVVKTETTASTKSDKKETSEKVERLKTEPVKGADKSQTAQITNDAKADETKKEAKPVRVASLPQANDASPSADAEFRWPVKGRVISQFGSKASGGANDGINIAVPEGTPVKSAESGQVIYAGNELKGYGNLVLVRHDNGWVSAYGHNSEVMVRKGDRVVRGQNIARAGQTGDVASPQLHFELRKGSKPVNPLEHLP